MTGENHRIVWQGKEFALDRIDNLFMTASGKIGAADAQLKQRISGDQKVCPGVWIT